MIWCIFTHINSPPLQKKANNTDKLNNKPKTLRNTFSFPTFCWSIIEIFYILCLLNCIHFWFVAYRTLYMIVSRDTFWREVLRNTFLKTKFKAIYNFMSHSLIVIYWKFAFSFAYHYWYMYMSTNLSDLFFFYFRSINIASFGSSHKDDFKTVFKTSFSC